MNMVHLALPLVLLAAMVFPALAQQPATGPRFDFQTPNTWRGEVIALPPGFASDLKWKGIENIRFAPGMFKPESESFFSYLLVFLLDKDADVSDKAIEEQVLTYYRGLAKAVAGNALPDMDTSAFTLALKKLPLEKEEANKRFPKLKEAPVRYWEGTLDWIEPFATRKPQTLKLEVNLWLHEDQPALYFAVSPQPADHAIWTEMRSYRRAFSLVPR